MQIRILSAPMAMAISVSIAMALANTGIVQAMQPTGTNPPSAPMAGGLPPLPRSCEDSRTMPPPPPRPPMAANDNLAKQLGIGTAQAAQVQQVFEKHMAQAQKLDEQRRAMDAQTCSQLKSIIGDQAMTRWASLTPPPPPPPPFGPGHGPNGMVPPPPPLPPPPPQGR